MHVARRLQLRRQHDDRTNLALFVVPSGVGAGDLRTAQGPHRLLQLGFARMLHRLGWRPSTTTIGAACTAKALPGEEAWLIARRLAAAIEPAVAREKPFLVLGGDHSIAMGTWSGAAQALRPRGPLGLVWIDAHLDAHTPATTPSGNWHGMPVAHLLGASLPDRLGWRRRRPALRPEHLCIVGARSFEPPEVAFLARLGVHVIDNEEIGRIGLASALSIAISLASAGTAGFGVSLDLDVIDPALAPGVGTAVPGGLDAVELTHALGGLCQRPGFVGLEVVEYNPALDVDQCSARIALALIASVLRRSPRTGRQGCFRALQKRPRAVSPA